MYIFVDGVPDKIDRTYFRSHFGDRFPALLDSEYNDFLDNEVYDIYVMFAGVNALWSGAPLQLWYDKARKCYGLLLAWYLTDTYPSLTAGVASSSGIPILSKSIGGVKIAFGDPHTANNKLPDLLSDLRSNPFGNKAYMMIKTAAQRFYIRSFTSHTVGE